MLTQVAHDVGELTVLSRTGGAPTFAVGMASILSGVFGGNLLMGIWYHFAILFEALFILTTVDAGTRVCRFMIQDFVGNAIPAFKETKSWTNNIIGSALACALWGYFLYQGVIDPLGGINSLWPLFGISNQLLAAIALSVATTLVIKSGRARYAWTTLLPLSWLLCVTLTAGYEKIWSPSVRIGFLAHAADLQSRIDGGQVAAAKLPETQVLIFNDRLDAAVTGVFMALVLIIVVESLREWYRVLGAGQGGLIDERIGAPA